MLALYRSGRQAEAARRLPRRPQRTRRPARNRAQRRTAATRKSDPHPRHGTRFAFRGRTAEGHRTATDRSDSRLGRSRRATR
jgi:hypothetical protein